MGRGGTARARARVGTAAGGGSLSATARGRKSRPSPVNDKVSASTARAGEHRIAARAPGPATTRGRSNPGSDPLGASCETRASTRRLSAGPARPEGAVPRPARPRWTSPPPRPGGRWPAAPRGRRPVAADAGLHRRSAGRAARRLGVGREQRQTQGCARISFMGNPPSSRIHQHRALLGGSALQGLQHQLAGRVRQQAGPRPAGPWCLQRPAVRPALPAAIGAGAPASRRWAMGEEPRTQRRMSGFQSCGGASMTRNTSWLKSSASARGLAPRGSGCSST